MSWSDCSSIQGSAFEGQHLHVVIDAKETHETSFVEDYFSHYEEQYEDIEMENGICNWLPILD